MQDEIIETQTEEVETQPEVKIETEAEVEIEPKTEVETEPEVEPEAKPETEDESEVEAEPEIEAEPEAEVKAEPESEVKDKVKIEVEPEVEVIEPVEDVNYKQLYNNMKLQNIDANFEKEFLLEGQRDYDQRRNEYILFATKNGIDFKLPLEELPVEHQAMVVPFLNEQQARTQYKQDMFIKETALMKAAIVLESKEVDTETFEAIVDKVREGVAQINTPKSIAEIQVFIESLLLEQEVSKLQRQLAEKPVQPEAEIKPESVEPVEPAIKADIKAELKPTRKVEAGSAKRVFSAADIKQMSTAEYLANQKAILAQMHAEM